MKLIILNGPSGVGKSTIAARLQEDMADSVIVDIDEIRRSIPNYRENRKESSLLSYQKAEEAIATHLKDGKTVIVDKTISYSDTLNSFIEAGRRLSAEVYELFVFADKEIVQQRADARGYRPGSLLDRERVGTLWDQLDALRKQRNGAVTIDTSSLSPDEVYEKVKSAIA